MPLIGSLNLGLQVAQRDLHPLNIFFFIIAPNSPHGPPVYMARGVPVNRYADRVISRQQNEREHVSAICDRLVSPVLGVKTDCFFAAPSREIFNCEAVSESIE